MAKKTTPKATRPRMNPVPFKLDFNERQRLIALLNDPVMQKALSNAASQKPGVHLEHTTGIHACKTQTPEAAAFQANNRLHEIKGWELYELALYRQTFDPKPQRQPVAENYPDAGRIDNE